MAETKTGRNIDRRTLLWGAAAAGGLAVAWAVWPRTYVPNLSAGEGETVFGAWLKIGVDGRVVVAVPQAELGQGVYTALPQILADELGADWRTVSVEAAPINAIYANPMAAATLFEAALDRLPEGLQRTHARRMSLMLTAGSTSVRAFETQLREAGAAARVLLCKAAAQRWDVDWRACATAEGFVVHGKSRLRFGELAAEAAEEDLPDVLPMRTDDGDRLFGQTVARLDSPAKVDGSMTFAGDVRMPGMMFAAIRQGPIGDSRLVRADRAAAERVPDVAHVVTTDGWVAAVAHNWWAANRALDALAPRFETHGAIVDSESIAAALAGAFDEDGTRIASEGDLSEAFRDAEVMTAEYRVGPALHAAIETSCATASWADGQLTLWMPTQAPSLARAAAARVIGVGEGSVVLHPTAAGGSFGARLEHLVAEQAALIAYQIGKPVQLSWSRSEECLHDRYRPPAVGRLTARLAKNGAILGWQTKIAAPRTGRELARRLLAGDPAVTAGLAVAGGGDPNAVAGAVPFYRIPSFAVDHYPAEIGIPTGHWRSGAHSYTAFFNESFIDELARIADAEPISYRIGMLGNDVRLAKCLATVASLGGWKGGVEGSGQGVACHSFRDSHVALLAEVRVDGGRSIRVERLVAAVDCGRVVNPDLVRQQIEGGLVFGLAAAFGCTTGFTDGLADVRGFSGLKLPSLGDVPDITIDLIDSQADPGGVGELAVPVVAPAIANAVYAAMGARLRELPLSLES